MTGGGDSLVGGKACKCVTISNVWYIFCVKKGRGLYYGNSGDFLTYLVLIMGIICVLHHPFTGGNLVLKSDWLVYACLV